jgi:hypothetical protein
MTLISSIVYVQPMGNINLFDYTDNLLIVDEWTSGQFQPESPSVAKAVLVRHKEIWTAEDAFKGIAGS